MRDIGAEIERLEREILDAWMALGRKMLLVRKLKGLQARLRLGGAKPCPGRCGGTGFLYTGAANKRCPVCAGIGQVAKDGKPLARLPRERMGQIPERTGE